MRFLRRRLRPDEFRSAYTGDILRWWRCEAHGSKALGNRKDAPHHCRGVWDEPLTKCRWAGA